MITTGLCLSESSVLKLSNVLIAPNGRKMICRIWAACFIAQYQECLCDIMVSSLSFSQFCSSIWFSFFLFSIMTLLCYAIKQHSNFPPISAIPLTPSNSSACLLLNHFMLKNTWAELNEACNQMTELYLIIIHNSSLIYDFSNYLPCGGHQPLFGFQLYHLYVLVPKYS